MATLIVTHHEALPDSQGSVKYGYSLPADGRDVDSLAEAVRATGCAYKELDLDAIDGTVTITLGTLTNEAANDIHQRLRLAVVGQPA